MTCLTGLAIADTNIADEAVSSVSPQLPFDIPKLTDDATSTAGLPSAPATGAVGAQPAMQAGPMAGAPIEDIRDIRGPIPIPETFGWVWLTLMALTTLAVLALAWRRYRRRSLLRAKRAYEIAFEQLEKARALMKPEEAREFSFLVSETVRTYIDHRYAIGAGHCTTEEFVWTLIEDPSSPLQAHTETLRDFLGYCDFAKFARWTLSTDQMEAMHASAWRFVEETRPRPEDPSKSVKRTAKRKQGDIAPSAPALAAGGVS